LNGRPKVKSALQQRLSLLEAKLGPITNPITYHYGWVRPLPKDYVGERHVVTVKVSPTGSPYLKWCEFEERPGPAPRDEDDPSFVVYLNK
jgi:hypothetical protein